MEGKTMSENENAESPSEPKVRKKKSITVEVPESTYKKLKEFAAGDESKVPAMAAKAIASGLKNAKTVKTVAIKW